METEEMRFLHALDFSALLGSVFVECFAVSCVKTRPPPPFCNLCISTSQSPCPLPSLLPVPPAFSHHSINQSLTRSLPTPSHTPSLIPSLPPAVSFYKRPSVRYSTLTNFPHILKKEKEAPSDLNTRGGDFMHAGALDYAMHHYAQLCTIMHDYAGCIATKTHRDCKQEEPGIAIPHKQTTQ